jgi:hypothetical protein
MRGLLPTAGLLAVLLLRGRRLLVLIVMLLARVLRGVVVRATGVGVPGHGEGMKMIVEGNDRSGRGAVARQGPDLFSLLDDLV